MRQLLFSILVFFPLAAHSILLSDLKENQEVSKFSAKAIYTDTEDKVMAAQFVFKPSRTPVYVVEIETVPQAYIWFDTIQNDNRGLPHSLEHLLVGKGTKGRILSLFAQMNLAGTAAATDQTFTYYQFYSVGNLDVFFQLFSKNLDALLQPDFSDDEAEREFYHIGIQSNQGSDQKSLVEKGTVYNEVADQNKDGHWYELRKMMLGQNHPGVFSFGGDPDAMRGVHPADIREFHRTHYQLGPSTGMVVVKPPKNELSEFLSGLSDVLTKYVPAKIPDKRKDLSQYKVEPSPNPNIKIVPYPAKEDREPGYVLFGWKPIQVKNLQQRILLSLLLDNFAGGNLSQLYKALIDSKSRSLDLGVKGVSYSEDGDISPTTRAIIISFSGIPGNEISEERVTKLCDSMMDGLKKLAQLKDGSQEVLDLNNQAIAFSNSWKRSFKIWSASPPYFGHRGTGSDWKRLFHGLEINPAFKKSLVYKDAWDEVFAQLQSKKNIWADLIRRFHLLDMPYATGAKASAQLADEIGLRGAERIKTKMMDLQQKYGAPDPQAALEKFEKDEQIKTDRIAQTEDKIPRLPFMQSPPLTYDDDIKYQRTHTGTSPILLVTFEGTSTYDFGITFDIEGLPHKYYIYMPLVAQTLMSIGAKTKDGIIDFREIARRASTEINYLSATPSTNGRLKKHDFAIYGSGVGLEEFKKAVSMADLVTHHGFLDLENIDRIRDLIDQNISSLSHFTSQSEESWIRNPVSSFRYQDDPLYLSIASHFTLVHYFDRLKWQFKDHSKADVDSLSKFTLQLIRALKEKKNRPEQKQVLENLREKGLKADFVQLVLERWIDIPDRTFIATLSHLRKDLISDLQTGPSGAIANLRFLQNWILNRRHVRAYALSTSRDANAVKEELGKLISSFGRQNRNTEKPIYSRRRILENIIVRDHKTRTRYPLVVALLNPSTANGNAVIQAQGPSYEKTDYQSLVEILAGKALSGSGPESLFMKTWEAGLAYNSGAGTNRSTGYIEYYADRSPNIPTTLDFVSEIGEHVDEIFKPEMIDSLYSELFSNVRATETFSARASGLFNDLQEGETPEKVKAFSQAVLNIRNKPELFESIKKNAASVLSKIFLHSGSEKLRQKAASICFLIAPESQIAEAEKSPVFQQSIARIWPSDFWLD